MDRVHAFDDARLNADLATILRLDDGADMPSIGRRRRRWRDAITHALRSPRASATIGASFFIAMLGTTAVLMSDPHGGQTIEATPAPEIPGKAITTTHSVQAAAIGDTEAAVSPVTKPLPARILVDASHDGKHVRSSRQSRSRSSTRQSGPPTAVADSEGNANVPAIFDDQGTPDVRRATDLAQNMPPPDAQQVKSAAVEVNAAPIFPDDADTERRSAAARRNSVTAIRALRRQW